MAPERVGPYRVERTLGAGGMGVVYAAWDERLERRVALKQIRPEIAGDPQRRERFRREARAVAKLDHPNVVHIHDLLETPEGDWLVLQYVEGPTLAERLRQGPLAPEEVVALARDVLSALQAAHAQSLLHRDLKAENVVLTPSGRAMVLDFGLAKLFETASPASETATSSAHILGTWRAMSPEQANGLPLDPRSDLFSLGVLLYEAATGRSPFRAETPVATLTRVCTHLQAPVRELAPAVSEKLSAWIDALLEKEAGRRPRSAGEALTRLERMEAPAIAPAPSPADLASAETAASAEPRTGAASWPPYRGLLHPRHLPLVVVLVLLTGLGLFAAWRLRPTREPLYVAVARPEVGLGAGREEVALAASALQAASLRALSTLQGIAALTPTATELGEPAPSVRKLSRLLAADEVLTSSLDCQTRHCLAVLRRVRGADGKVLDTQTFEVPLDDLRLLDTAAATYLKHSYDGFHTRPDASPVQVRSEDYQRFLRVQRTWEEERPSDLEPLLAELRRIQEESPLFLDAYLLHSSLKGYRFFQTRNAEDLNDALELLAQARRLAPEDPGPLLALLGVTLSAGRIAEAGETLRELELLLPGDVRTLARRALLCERQGDKRQALELLRTAVERRPSANFLMDLANLELRLGEIPAARSTLEKLLRRLPGHAGGETLLAQLELEAGDPAHAAELYTGLARRRPTFSAFSNLGLSQLLLGQYHPAAASLERAYSLAPQSYIAALNLGDVQVLIGQPARAESLYRRVIELVSQDPAPDDWQKLGAKAQAQAHLGDRSEAATSIQQALVTAPDNPEVAYAAALVYSVIGDTASALASAGRALDLGYNRRWLSLPWFDPLRNDPEFRERLEGAGEKA